MKLIVFSDSHGRTDLLRRAAEAHFADPDTAGVVHLGDGIEDLSFIDTGRLPLWRVRGNFEDCMYSFASRCDAPPRELIFELGGYRIMIMHGHRFGVKNGYERAAGYAAEQGADLLMFGHTHIMFESYIPAGETLNGVTLQKPLYLFNPGTAGTGLHRSYGVVELRPEGIVCSHACNDR